VLPTAALFSWSVNSLLVWNHHWTFVISQSMTCPLYHCLSTDTRGGQTTCGEKLLYPNVIVWSSGRSIVQRSPTDCGACLSVIKWKYTTSTPAVSRQKR
jgi:hypothetical protein